MKEIESTMIDAEDIDCIIHLFEILPYLYIFLQINAFFTNKRFF